MWTPHSLTGNKIETDNDTKRHLNSTYKFTSATSDHPNEYVEEVYDDSAIQPMLNSARTLEGDILIYYWMVQQLD